MDSGESYRYTCVRCHKEFLTSETSPNIDGSICSKCYRELYEADLQNIPTPGRTFNRLKKLVDQAKRHKKNG